LNWNDWKAIQLVNESSNQLSLFDTNIFSSLVVNLILFDVSLGFVFNGSYHTIMKSISKSKSVLKFFLVKLIELNVEKW
jgi:hypothetical protein